MRIVALEREIFITKGEQIAHGRIQSHGRPRARLTRQLQSYLLEMIAVDVRVAERVHEVARLEVAHLRDHERQQRVAGDIEWHAEKNVGAALIKLATQFAVLHVELK